MRTEDERDEDVMARVADGEAPALERLVRRHATPLLTFIVRLVGDRHRGEELFQEVFLAVWTKRRLYEHPRPFRPWLYTIALNRCRAEMRRQPPPTGPLAAEPAAAAAVDPVEAGETAEHVARAVLRLPPRQREVVTLRVWEGMPYARISEVVGCSEVTVRSHMHQALAALRRDLARCFGERAGRGGHVRE
jgi:RNA polymerase sigma-70 factor (ECF subfamily)